MSQDYFTIQKIGLRFVGFWPGGVSRHTKFNLIRTVLNILIILLASTFETLHAYETLINNRVGAAIEGFCPTATKIVSAIKLWVLFYQRREVQEIVDTVQTFYDGKFFG